MPRKPEQPTCWNIYKVAAKAILLGTVEAPDKGTAIKKGAEEFKADAWAPERGAAAMPRRKGEITPHWPHGRTVCR